jgi:hypothetical protein
MLLEFDPFHPVLVHHEEVVRLHPTEHNQPSPI